MIFAQRKMTIHSSRGADILPTGNSAVECHYPSPHHPGWPPMRPDLIWSCGEREWSGDLLLPRWSISGGVSADRNVILGQGRRNGLVSSWEGNFHWQHVIPFATGLHCCEFLPTLSWTLNKRKWLSNGMGSDFNWFPEPWQYHMNNDRCMYTETNPV